MADLALERRDVLASMLEQRGDALIVCGLGSPVWDVAALDHRGENFYVWGGMGCASVMGLGLALAQPDRKVWVVTGDGEALMGVGTLATIGGKRPANLAVIVFDNEHYAETGMQQTHTGMGTDLAAMAKAAGIPTTMDVRTNDQVAELTTALSSGPMPLFANVKITNDQPERILPPRDGVHLKNAFRIAVLGEKEAMYP